MNLTKIKSLDEFRANLINENIQLPFDSEVSVLGEKAVIGDKVINNRLICQPMEGCDGTLTGRPGELTIRRYKRFAKGGAGLIWFEATSVQEDGRANPRQLYINTQNLDSFKYLIDEIKEKFMPHSICNIAKIRKMYYI